VPLVQDEHFVEQCCTRAPVAKDEDRRVRNWTTANGTAVNDLLNDPQKGVKKADKSNEDGDVPVGRVDGEAVVEEQPHPGEEIAAAPHVSRPLARLRLFRLRVGPAAGGGGHNGRCGGQWRGFDGHGDSLLG
jgi:hypothetical protein